jgi:hypothetical protein
MFQQGKIMRYFVPPIVIPVLLVIGIVAYAVFKPPIIASHVAAQSRPASPTDLSSSAPTATTLSGDERNDTKKLESDKLEAEINKLRSDIWTAYITPIVSFLSALGVVVTILVQRQTALNIQKQTEKTNLELKVADFVMNSVGPTMARQRLGIFQDLYQNRLSPEFIQAIRNTDLIKQDHFPGTRRDQLRVELFKAIAATADSPNAAIDAFRSVFPTENLL